MLGLEPNLLGDEDFESKFLLFEGSEPPTFADGGFEDFGAPMFFDNLLGVETGCFECMC